MDNKYDIVLDTETTGLSMQEDRIIEIGAVKVRLEDRKVLSTFHTYINADRSSSPAALAVHGITDEFLRDKPRFEDIYQEFLGFVGDSSLVIHNAAFDMGFLQAELDRVKHPIRLDALCPVVDTWTLAKKQFPGQKNNLDALCNRFGIDVSHRSYHGALKDADLLVKVYFALLTSQHALSLDDVESGAVEFEALNWTDRSVVLVADAQEMEEDATFFSQD